MCFSVWQLNWKAGGKGSGEEAKDLWCSGTGVKPALSFSDKTQQKAALRSDHRDLGASEKSGGWGGLSSPGCSSEGMRARLPEGGQLDLSPSPWTFRSQRGRGAKRSAAGGC